MKDRDVTAMLMGLTVAWHTYGFATGFFGRAWRDAPVPVIPISYALNAALTVFAPLARGGKRGTALISSVMGILVSALLYRTQCCRPFAA